nr:glycosyltransferase [uncultured Desulfobacter sp.]
MKLKILIAGDWHSELHEQAVYNALRGLGHDVHKFAWCEYFSNKRRGAYGVLRSLSNRLQNKYIVGGAVRQINSDFIQQIKSVRPNLVFIYRGTHIWPNSISIIKKFDSSIIVVGYNNDDPFSQGYSKWFWRNFVKSIPLYDMTLAYRQRNLDDFIKAGAKRVKLLRSWFIPERNHPMPLSPGDLKKYGCDVAFIGHYERDGRFKLLEEVAKEGFHLKLYGPGYEWDSLVKRTSSLRLQYPVRLVWGKEYNKAICGAKIALCFLSKLNRDTYTRRCFEIPASGTLMLAEYSQDLASLYVEGKEAEFFRNKSEFIEKISWYLKNDRLREEVAKAGYKKVKQDKHDVTSRMIKMLNWVEEL